MRCDHDVLRCSLLIKLSLFFICLAPAYGDFERICRGNARPGRVWCHFGEGLGEVARTVPSAGTGRPWQ